METNRTNNKHLRDAADAYCENVIWLLNAVLLAATGLSAILAVAWLLDGVLTNDARPLLVCGGIVLVGAALHVTRMRLLPVLQRTLFTREWAINQLTKKFN